jgi:hypothetical protein
MGERAVGRDFKIRTQKATKHQPGVVIEGKIESCVFLRWRNRGRSYTAQWNVKLAGHEGTFVMERIPR